MHEFIQHCTNRNLTILEPVKSVTARVERLDASLGSEITDSIADCDIK